MAIWVVVAVLGVFGLVMMLRRRRTGALAHIPWVDGPWVPFLGNSVSVVWAKGDLAAVLAGPWSSRSFAVVDLQYPRILINDVSLAVAILNHKDMDKGPSKGAFKMLFGDGLASLVHQPELWKPHRTLLRPRFATSGLAPHLPDMHRIASTRIANALNGPQPLNISALCREVTFAILFELIFEAPSNSHDFALILESLTELNRAFVFADLDVALAETPVIGPLLPGRSYRRCLELVGKVHAVSQRMCDVDSCPSIVNAMRESGSYTPAQVLDECLTLFFGGFDTTAISLLRTMVMLSQHPAAMEELRNAVDAHWVPDDVECVNQVAPLTAALDAVIKESMRLDPAVGAHVRYAKEDLLINDVLHVPAGVECLINLVHLQRDPAVWGADAAVFRPSRWLDGSCEEAARSWLPFGGGRRICIGMHLSLFEQRLFLAQLVRTVGGIRIEDGGQPYHSMHGVTNGFDRDVMGELIALRKD